MSSPRVRFAPAPSGWLHVGGARTALYNWLYARRHHGEFVLRIEDTDAERVSDSATEGVLEALRFLNLDWDEGPGHGGPYGPYRQSERAPLYAAVAHLLLEHGHVYDAYETPGELEDMRLEAQRQGRPPGYDGAHRELTQDQREAFLAEGRRATLRVRTPDQGTVAFVDGVRGEIEFAWADIPDFVLTRADGSPTYYLANTVDDLAMAITFVARGEDLLSATPRQLFMTDLLLGDEDILARALEAASLPPRPAERERPAYAHLPIIVGADRKKLSKRHGSVAIDEFRRQGFLPEALVNGLALCGWSPDATTERMDPDELVERFSFDRVGRSAAYFDTDKLRAMNGDRIKDLSDAQLTERLQPYFEEAGLVVQPPTPAEAHLLRGFAPLLRDRIQTLGEAPALVAPFFAAEVAHDEAAVAKHLQRSGVAELLAAAADELAAVEPWAAPEIMGVLDDLAARFELSRGKTMQPVRVAVAGVAVSPPLPETLALLDRDIVVARLSAARSLSGVPR